MYSIQPATSICRLLEQCKPKQLIDHGGLVAGRNDGDVAFDARFDCGLHPRHHCDNLESAHKCSSFETCMRNWIQPGYQYVLNVQQSSVDAELTSQKTCGFCIFLFNKLHSALELNETEVDVEQYLMGACSLLPTKGETDMVIFFPL